LRRQPEVADGLIAATTTVTLDFALAQRQAGADVVMIAEPTGTGEVLGGAHFSRFAAPALARVLAALARQGVPTVLHICGDVRPILPQVRDLAAGLSRPLALSVDAMVSGVRLQRELPGVVRVGNVDAELLRRGPLARIETAARRAAAEFEVVTPACGLVPDTPAAHLQALVRSVQAHDPGTRTRPAAGTALTGVR
jgi:[methyl-Co(III) methanol-specific corrinoid protein]:coenzyme M methyltransferase